ncbi:hypothetical protein L204_105131 [Cryptococcus depauperatus]
MGSLGRPQYLSSASALIKALRASSDPPEDSWPSKIHIALEAYDTADFRVPRKSELLRDWVLESWTKTKFGDKNNALVHPDYHRLISNLKNDNVLQSPPPLQILSTFFSSLSLADSWTVVPLAAQSFSTLFDPQDLSYKVEDWVEVWISLLKYLCTRESKGAARSPLSHLVAMVAAGIDCSQTSGSSKKTVIKSFSTYSKAFLTHTPLRARLNNAFANILFHTTALQISDPLGCLYSSIEAELEQASITQGYLLAIPSLFESLISIYHRNSFTLFTQASSSKVPHDVFAASQERDAIRNALEKTLALFDNIETKQSRADLQGINPWVVKTWIWQSRAATWQALAAWGGYMEQEELWGRLVDATARRAEAALSTYAGDGSGESSAFLGTVLEVLVTLEKLDHNQAKIGPDVVRWCLAAPTEQQTVASTLLSSLLRFYQLTRTIPAFFTLLSSSLQGLYDSTLPDDIIQSLYFLTVNGPLITQHFREDLVAALRSSVPGRRRSAHWNQIFTDLATSVQALLSLESQSERESKKRKRSQSITSRSAVMIGIQTRLLSHCLEAAVDTTFDGEPNQDALSNFLPFLENWASSSELSRVHRKGEADSKLWAMALSQAGRVRLIRNVEKVLRRQVARDEDIHFDVLRDASCPNELRLEWVRLIFHRAALQLQLKVEIPSSFKTEVDTLLSLLEATFENPGFQTNALWQIIVQQGIVLLDLLATSQQLCRLAALFVKAISQSSHIQCLFATADIWELQRLRDAFQDTLLRQLPLNPGSLIPFLEACPMGYLKRRARNEAVERLYREKDLNKSLPWLSRMAVKSDILGPLARDADVVIKVAKIAGKQIDNPSVSALWKTIISHLISAPTLNEDLLMKILEYFEKTVKRIQKGKNSNTESALQALTMFYGEVMNYNVQNLNQSLQSQMVELCRLVISYVQPRLMKDTTFAISDSASLINIYNTSINFLRWTGASVEQTSFGMDLARQVLKNAASMHQQETVLKCGQAVLELLSSEAESIHEPLAASIAFYSVFPEALMGNTVRNIFKDRSEDVVKACIGLAEGKLRSQKSALCVIKALIGFCSRSDIVKQALRAGIHTNTGGFENAISFVETIVESKATALQTDDALFVLLTVYRSLLCDTSTSTFASIVKILHTISRRRPELIFATLPQVIQILCYVFPKFHISCSILPTGQEMQLKGSFGIVEARIFSRLLIAVAQAKIPKTKIHETSPLAKHVPALLVAYVRACADPALGYTTGVRKELEIGLYALCDLATSGGRANARGREGEGLGTPFGLGEGPSGEGEKELWAELWKGWSKGRYMGQG